MTDTTWPPPWTLKPTFANPYDSSDDAASPESIGWSIGWGFRFNVGHAVDEDITSPLVVEAHFSDDDAARGFCKRQVTPEQLEEFARLLLNVAAAHKRREAGR